MYEPRLQIRKARVKFLIRQINRAGYAAELKIRGRAHVQEQRCGIVTLESPHPEDVEQALHQAGVIVDSRPGRVRLSPHWCVTEPELDRGMDLVFDHLAAAAKTG